MTAKEYLEQAYRLDQRIDAKIAQVASLNELATKCTAAMTGMPHSPNRGASPMANTIDKIIDLQREINEDIDALVDLKQELLEVISAVESENLRTLLEKRYLGHENWDSVADALCCGRRWALRLHDQALAEVEKILEKMK